MQIIESVLRSATAIAAALAACLAVSCDTSEGPEPRPAPIKGEGMVLNAPNGGETFRVGDTVLVDWDLDSSQVGQMIQFSPDNGFSFVTVGRVVSGEENYMHGPYYWVIPDSAPGPIGKPAVCTVSDSCTMRIFDYSVVTSRDMSDNVFSIKPRAL